MADKLNHTLPQAQDDTSLVCPSCVYQVLFLECPGEAKGHMIKCEHAHKVSVAHIIMLKLYQARLS